MEDREGIRDAVIGWIADFTERYCADHGEEPIWRRPLVGLADAESPMFPELKTIAYPGHRLPGDYLPGARTVISFFMPFSEDVADDNRRGDRPTESWAHAYALTNGMCAEMCRHIAAMVESLGYRAAVPEDAGEIVDGTYSRWSQRHVARIAGLGSFGMNRMLITEEGCAGRYFSVVTDIPCPHDPPFTGERCLHRADGSCGVCMRACPVSALGDGGFARELCLRRCTDNVPLSGHQICGKCLVGMPCTFRDPSV